MPTTLSILLCALFLAGISFLLLRRFERRQIFTPTRNVTRHPSDIDLPCEDIRFVAEDSTFLQGWWIPGENPIGTLIYLHGSGGNMGDRVDVLRDLHRLNLNLFTFDYRGYGESRGRPSEDGVYRDARAAYEVVRSRHEDMDEPPVVLYGRSLGGAIAIQLAADRPVRGLIVEASFLSIADMARERHPRLPHHLLGSIRFPSEQTIRDLKMPKLIAHSPDDELIPYHHGTRLFETAPEPRTFADLTGPHDFVGWVSKPAYWETFSAFIETSLQT